MLQLLRKLPEIPKLSGTIDSLRTAQLERKKALTAILSPGRPDVTEIDITVLARDGYQIPVRVYQPSNFQTGRTAAAVMLHGGGFCIGGLSNEELNCRNFASRLGVTSLNVDYRLAPEHPYPVPVNDCWDVLKWVCTSFCFIGLTAIFPKTKLTTLCWISTIDSQACLRFQYQSGPWLYRWGDIGRRQHSSGARAHGSR